MKLTKEQTEQMFKSMRGQLIISQALVLAVNQLKQVDGPMRQVSNILDMEDLITHIFPLCNAINTVDLGLAKPDKIVTETLAGQRQEKFDGVPADNQ